MTRVRPRDFTVSDARGICHFDDCQLRRRSGGRRRSPRRPFILLPRGHLTSPLYVETFLLSKIR